MKQNNLLRVYMKSEQQSYSGRARGRFRGAWRWGWGGWGSVGGGNEKTRKISVLDMFFRPQLKLRWLVLCRSKCIYTLTECIFSSFLFLFLNTQPIKMEESNGERCDAFLSTPKCFCLWRIHSRIHAVEAFVQSDLTFFFFLLETKMLTEKDGVWRLHAAFLETLLCFLVSFRFKSTNMQNEVNDSSP